MRDHFKEVVEELTADDPKTNFTKITESELLAGTRRLLSRSPSPQSLAKDGDGEVKIETIAAKAKDGRAKGSLSVAAPGTHYGGSPGKRKRGSSRSASCGPLGMFC